jgi:hypothetical protein
VRFQAFHARTSASSVESLPSKSPFGTKTALTPVRKSRLHSDDLVAATAPIGQKPVQQATKCERQAIIQTTCRDYLFADLLANVRDVQA